jgi:hypothetical protein
MTDTQEDKAKQQAFLARKCHLCGFRFDDGLHDPEETLMHDHKFAPAPQPLPVEGQCQPSLSEVHAAWRDMMNAIEVYKARVTEYAVAEACRPLVKAAYEDARTLHYVTHIGKNGFEDFNDCDKPKCVNARAAVAPPTPSVESEGEANA